MKVYKKYGLEDKSYTQSWLDNLELNSVGIAKQRINYSYCREINQPWKVPQLFYQGNVYAYWKSSKAKLEVKLVSSTTGKEIARKHLENIRSRLEQRLKSAKAKGDRELISLLERERQLT